jgi:hypothetical protein
MPDLDMAKNISDEPDSSISRWKRLEISWMPLAEQLLTVFRQCVICVQPTLSPDARAEAAQATLEAALAGVSQSLALIGSSSDNTVGMQPPLQGNAWTELGHAYAAAFASAGSVVLRATGKSQNPPALAPEMARLALRAAETLAHGMGLLFGLRRSGSIAHVCAHIGSLESQADSLKRAFLTSPPASANAEGEGKNGRSDDVDRQLLAALEAMTDRCEEVADALLTVARVMQQPQRP